MLLAVMRLMMTILLTFVFSVGAQTTNELAVENTAAVTIHAIGFRNNNGVVRIAMFHGNQGFPDDISHAYWKGVRKIHNCSAKVLVSGVTYGTYAISVHRDANNNGRLDKLFRVIPKEGFGSSNNIRDEKQGPTYDQSSFEVNSDSTTITIEMKYLFGK